MCQKHNGIHRICTYFDFVHLISDTLILFVMPQNKNKGSIGFFNWIFAIQ